MNGDDEFGFLDSGITDASQVRQRDGYALRLAAEVLVRYSKRPGSFWLGVLVRVLSRTAERIEQGELRRVRLHQGHAGSVVFPDSGSGKGRSCHHGRILSVLCG